MTDWVEYSNATEGKFADMRKKNGHPTPLNVKIWSVGNERSGRDYIHKVRDAGSSNEGNGFKYSGNLLRDSRRFDV